MKLIDRHQVRPAYVDLASDAGKAAFQMHRLAGKAAVIQLRMAVHLSKADLLRTLEAARPELEDIHYAATLRMTYQLLWHDEAEVLLFCRYLLATDRVDLAVAVLEGWNQNPWREQQ